MGTEPAGLPAGQGEASTSPAHSLTLDSQPLELGEAGLSSRREVSVIERSPPRLPPVHGILLQQLV